MRKLISLDEFATVARASSITGARLAPPDVELAVARDSTGVVTSEQTSGRTIGYKFSDQSVARDGHTIRSAGFELGNFRANPVFLWAHDASAPPIGRVSNLRVNDAQELVGQVEYIAPDISQFADMIYRMTKARFLNAVSISWRALEYKFSSDPARRGGIDFLRQEMLEASAVPVPALASALANARDYGISTQPMIDWAGKVLDGGGMLVVPRAEIERLRTAAGASPRTYSYSRADLNDTSDESSAVFAQLKAHAKALIDALDGRLAQGDETAPGVVQPSDKFALLATAQKLVELINSLKPVQSVTGPDGVTKPVFKFETPRALRDREAEAYEIAGRYIPDRPANPVSDAQAIEARKREAALIVAGLK